MNSLPALVEQVEKRHERNGIRLRDARVNQMPKWAYIAALESHDDCGHLLRIVKEMQAALGFGTEKDACINLGGAIIDIERDAHYNGIGAVDYTCDSVSLRTLMRVEAQLSRAAQCLAPQESTDGR